MGKGKACADAYASRVESRTRFWEEREAQGTILIRINANNLKFTNEMGERA